MTLTYIFYIFYGIQALAMPSCLSDCLEVVHFGSLFCEMILKVACA